MEDFHCEMLNLSVQLASLEEFDQEAFLKDIGVENKEEYTDEDGDMVFTLTFGARESTTDYHAHLRVLFFKAGKSRIELNYHESRAENIDDEPPYVEDSAQWLGRFIKTEKVAARISASYKFDSAFSPVIALPFPMLTSERALAGALVTGISVLLPKEGSSETAIIQSQGDETYIFLNSTSDISLKDFGLFPELERVSASVNSLIRKREAGNGDTQRNSK